ncbi:uncharacterized protein [Acropora muricata]|uniref:uncharacterized protein n=1 Tax=Acropora muricata TaxID=159855 RepID=UPI0034E48914
MKVNTARSANVAKLLKFANMKLKFHNVGFSPRGKPIFPNAASKRKKNIIGNSATGVSTGRSSPTPAKWRRFRSISCSPALRTRNPLGRLKPPLQRGRPRKFVDKFSPTKSGVSQLRVRFRGWLTRVEEIAEDRGLDFVEKRSRTKAFGIVSKAECDENTLSPLRIVFDVMGFYRIEVFFVVKERGRISSEENAKEVILKVFAPNSPFVVCRGIADYDENGKQLGYDLNCLRKWEMPFKRVDSAKCELLHKPKNRKRRSGDVLYDVCTPCKKLHRNISEALKRKVNGKSRTAPKSNCNWKFLSPKAARKRRNALSQSKRKLKRELKKLRTLQCTLSDQQDHEMRDIASIIERDFSSELQDVIDGSSKKENGKSKVLRAIWEQDVKDRKEFWNDQRRNRNGRNNNRWSIITYRMALAVFCRSPAAYEALSGFSILKLPSQESLKHLRSGYFQADGPNWENLEESAEDYKSLKEEKRNNGLKEPLGWGVLICDEVKVAAKIQWNSRNNEFIGHSLTPDDMVSLHDIYEELNANQKKMRASYVFQFLWRDLSSEFDVIGPYFKSEAGMKHQFVMTCILNTTHAFHLYSFEVMAIVLDGASTNLAAMKYFTMGRAGSYGINDDPSVDEPHHIQAWFTNPFTGTKIFFIPCPSHELKSIIAALSSSKPNGRKHFNLWGTNFGWKQIIAMWNRELDRARRNCMLRVPGLKYRFVFRDAWTRLNVNPAKLMQQDHVIGELKEYAATTPADADQVSMTVQFLEATQSLFEFGILSHEKILDASSSVLTNMEDGFLFFVAWADYCYSEGHNLATPSQTVFLAWQTWDLLRLMYYGFREFCQEFLQRFPGCYIVPLKINGSGIETIFSQLRFSTTGNLSGSNYGYALSALTLRRSLHGHGHGKSKYRNARLYVRQKAIKRKHAKR